MHFQATRSRFSLYFGAAFVFASYLYAPNETLEILPRNRERNRFCIASFLLMGEPISLIPNDVGVIRLDVSYLLYNHYPPHEIERLMRRGTFLHAFVSPEGPLELVSEIRRIYGNRNHRMEIIYFVRAPTSGSTIFSTSRYYEMEVGRTEMSSQEADFLRVLIQFRRELQERGFNSISFADYLASNLGPANTDLVLRILGDIGSEEQGKTLEEKLEIAERRIRDFQRMFTQPIYQTRQITGNVTPIEVTQQRRGVDVRTIHHVGPTWETSGNIQGETVSISTGDLLAVESRTPPYFRNYQSIFYDSESNGLAQLHVERLDETHFDAKYDPMPAGAWLTRPYRSIEHLRHRTFFMATEPGIYTVTERYRGHVWAQEYRTIYERRTTIDVRNR